MKLLCKDDNCNELFTITINDNTNDIEVKILDNLYFQIFYNEQERLKGVLDLIKDYICGDGFYKGGVVKIINESNSDDFKWITEWR